MNRLFVGLAATGMVLAGVSVEAAGVGHEPLALPTPAAARTSDGQTRPLVRLEFLDVGMRQAPAGLEPGKQAEVTLTFTLTSPPFHQPVHWNNLPKPGSALEITHVPAGLRLEPAKIRLPTPKEASSFEVRRVTLKLSADKKLSPGTRMLEAKLTYYVCEGDPFSGRCYRKKKSFKLPVLVGAFSAAPPAAGPAYKALKDFEHVRLEAGPAEVKAGASAVLALRFSLRKDAGKALRWNNLASSRLTLKPPRGLSVPQRKFELPRPGDEPSHEPRRITVRYAAEKSLAPGPYPIAARLTYYVTNVETGASFRRKEKFTLTVIVTEHPETPAKE